MSLTRFFPECNKFTSFSMVQYGTARKKRVNIIPS